MVEPFYCRFHMLAGRCPRPADHFYMITTLGEEYPIARCDFHEINSLGAPGHGSGVQLITREEYICASVIYE